MKIHQFLLYVVHQYVYRIFNPNNNRSNLWSFDYAIASKFKNTNKITTILSFIVIITFGSFMLKTEMLNIALMI